MKKLSTIVLLLFGLITPATYGQSFIKNFTSISELIEVNDQSFFSVNNRKELWKTKGTKETTFLVKDINAIGNSSIKNLTSFNDELYFSANDGFFGEELWKTDGTEAGTVLVKNIQKAFGQGSNPSNFTIYNNELYFTATDHFTSGSFQLWKTDGTEGGTIKVYDAGGINISDLLTVNNKLYFKLKYGPNKLMSFDITNGVNEVLIDEYYSINQLNSFNNSLYFITNTSNKQNIRIYKLNNTGSPILLQEFTQPQYGSIDIHNFTLVGTDIYFSITTDFNSGDDSDILWKSNGTNAGTSIVKSFNWNRHLSGSNISNFVEYKNELYFNSGSQNNYTLWKSDGFTTGTVEVVNISIDKTVKFQILKDVLYFSNANKLWSTDGTSVNTKKNSDLTITNKNSDDLFNVKSTTNTLFFEGDHQSIKGLYTTALNPLIEVKKGNSVIKVKSVVSFESKIDSVVRSIIKIKNIGNKDLIFSKIKIVGQNFYIDGKQSNNINNQNQNGDFSQILEPGSQSEFELSFYPSSKGMKKGTLSIFSNDLGTPNFNIELSGYAEDEIGQDLNKNLSLNKEINFDSSIFSIKLSTNSIQEDRPINSVVGTLSILNSNDGFTYTLSNVDGNLDNQHFSIVNNELKTSSNFNFEQKNTYVLNVSAVNNSTNKTIEERLIISISDVHEELILEACSLEVNNLGFGLNDVEFIDNQNVIAVGSHGVILKSYDGGNTWRKIRQDPLNHLNKVQFTSNTVGYAIGNNVLKTEDAGESWFTLTLPDVSYPIPTNLFFVNSNVGFVFGNDGKFFKTSNGGKYWTKKNIGYGDFNSAFFFNESDGYIVGNSKTIYKTFDGGDTLEFIDLKISELNSSTKLTNIYFVSNLIGYISGNKGEIIKTIDGGNTWTLVSKIEYNAKINNLVFKGENIGYALTEGALYKTTDGGITWSNENLEYFYSGFQSVGFNNDGSKSCLVGHGTTCCTGYSTGHIIYTKELENSWGNKSYLSLRSYPLNAIHIEDEGIGFVFGNNYAAKTIDGGLTWKNLDPPESYITQVKVLNNTVYLLGQNNIYKSTDSGETWGAISTPISFKKLFFINEQIIYALTSEYGIFKTTDGGVNWTQTSNNPSNGLNIFFLNENEGFIAGIEGLYKTVDGGNTWVDTHIEPMLNTESTIVHTIHFLNKDLGIAGSSTGLLKTVDGGDNWTRLNKNMGGIVKFIRAINEFEWLAITDYRVLKTSDGGINWTTIYYDQEINDVYFSDKKTYLAGYKNLTEITTKSQPRSPGIIQGNQIISSQSIEEYSVNNDVNVHYKWTVSGDNKISYNENKAEILWKSPGIYTVRVTPFDNCGSGIAKEIIVTVEEDWDAPVISGETEIIEFSLNNEYFTPLTNSSRYKWTVKGHTEYNKTANNVSINWGELGNGRIEVIETKINSGKRKKGYLDVVINSAALSLDDFNLEKKAINAFPNPTHGVFDIALPTTSFKKVKITVFSTNSQKISTQMYPVINGNVRLNIKHFPTGMYYIKVHIEVPRSLKIIKI